MRGTFQIARIANIPIRLHWSLGLVFLWIAAIAVGSGLKGQQILFMVGIVLSVFLLLVLHELGHGLTASKLHVRTEDILLSPVGGVARFQKLPEKPWKEILISLGGPAVNLVIGILLFVVIKSTDPDAFLFHPRFWRLEGAPGFLRYLFQINLVILVLNILPAYPLDGGRVFRALMTRWLGRDMATVIATATGLVVSSLIIARGLVMGDEVLAILGVLVFGAALSQIKRVKPVA